QRGVVREKFEQRLVAARDVVRIAGECGEAVRARPATEQGPNEGRYESGKGKRSSETSAVRLGANVVAVVEDDCAGIEIANHRLHVRAAALQRAPFVLVGVASA